MHCPNGHCASVVQLTSREVSTVNGRPLLCITASCATVLSPHGHTPRNSIHRQTVCLLYCTRVLATTSPLNVSEGTFHRIALFTQLVTRVGVAPSFTPRAAWASPKRVPDAMTDVSVTPCGGIKRHKPGPIGSFVSVNAALRSGTVVSAPEGVLAAVVNRTRPLATPLGTTTITVLSLHEAPPHSCGLVATRSSVRSCALPSKTTVPG